MKKILSLGLLLTLAACSTMGPIAEEKRSGITDVGMVYLVPAESKIVYMGTTIFENKEGKFQNNEWGLAGVMQQEFSDQLKAHGKKFVAVKVPAEAKPGKKYDEEDIKKIVAAAAPQGAKYLFVVQPTRHGSMPFPEGVGLYCRSAFGMKGSWTATYQVHVALWDTSSKEKVYQTAYMPGDGMYKSEKACAEWDQSKSQKFAEEFRAEMQKLAKAAALKVLQNSHLIPGKPKSAMDDL